MFSLVLGIIDSSGWWWVDVKALFIAVPVVESNSSCWFNRTANASRLMAHMGCGNNNVSPIDGVALAFWNRTFTVLRRHHRMRAERMAAYEKLNKNRLFRAWLKLIIHSTTILVVTSLKTVFVDWKLLKVVNDVVVNFSCFCVSNRKTAEDEAGKWVAILMSEILDPFVLIWIEKKMRDLLLSSDNWGLWVVVESRFYF